MFVIVFPQLLLVLYFDKANTYGSVSSYIIGLALRLACKYYIAYLISDLSNLITIFLLRKYYIIRSSTYSSIVFFYVVVFVISTFWQL